MLKICLISDTHNKHRQLRLPEADILIHSGDITVRGSAQELADFSNYLCDIRHLYDEIIVVPGNHDLVFQNDTSMAKGIISNNAHVLIDQSIEIKNLIVHGSPITVPFGGWAFEMDRSSRYDKYKLIPEKVDILVTHGPPHRILDLVHSGTGVENVGCPVLYDVVQNLRPSLHVFGHIHEGYGYSNVDGITYVNASICDHLYRPTRKPILIEFSRFSDCDFVKILNVAI